MTITTDLSTITTADLHKLHAYACAIVTDKDAPRIVREQAIRECRAIAAEIARRNEVQS